METYIPTTFHYINGKWIDIVTVFNTETHKIQTYVDGVAQIMERKK